MKSIILTRKDSRAIIKSLGEVSPGMARALWRAVRAVTRDEQRGERQRARSFRAAQREDWALVAQLRDPEVSAAYLLADQSRIERMRAIGIVLKCGDITEGAHRSGVHPRTLKRWIYEGPGSFFSFAAVYLSAKVKRARARLVKDRAEFEAKLAIAKKQCAAICNPEDKLGCQYESAGTGCSTCPIGALNRAQDFSGLESDTLITSRLAEIERETTAYAELRKGQLSREQEEQQQDAELSP